MRYLFVIRVHLIFPGAQTQPRTEKEETINTDTIQKQSSNNCKELISVVHKEMYQS